MASRCFNNKLYILGGLTPSGGGQRDQRDLGVYPTLPRLGTEGPVLPVPLGYVPTTAPLAASSTRVGAAISRLACSPILRTPLSMIRSRTPFPRLQPYRGPQARRRALNFNGQMLVMGGGRIAPNPSNEVDIYDPGTNTWTIGRFLRSQCTAQFPYRHGRHNAGFGWQAATIAMASHRWRRWRSSVQPRATPTPTPSPTATPTVAPSATPTVTPSVTPSATPTATPTSRPPRPE